MYKTHFPGVPETPLWSLSIGEVIFDSKGIEAIPGVLTIDTIFDNWNAITPSYSYYVVLDLVYLKQDHT